MPHPLRDQFIDALAEYLSRDLAKRSIQLEMGQYPEVKEWARLYTLSGCRGYATKAEAIAALTHVLYRTDPEDLVAAKRIAIPITIPTPRAKKPARKPAKR